MSNRQQTRRAGTWLLNDGSFTHAQAPKTWRCSCGHTFKSDSQDLKPEGCPECGSLEAKVA